MAAPGVSRAVPNHNMTGKVCNHESQTKAGMPGRIDGNAGRLDSGQPGQSKQVYGRHLPGVTPYRTAPHGVLIVKKLQVKIGGSWAWFFCHVGTEIKTTPNKRQALPHKAFWALDDLEWARAKFANHEFRLGAQL